MTPVLRAASVDDVPAVLAFWSVAAEDATDRQMPMTLSAGSSSATGRR